MTATFTAALEVVQPRAVRWRPTRAGLISLWRYWDETFTFHEGRLLLRGPNGSGKSMALELLLPFLLDADTRPNRLTSAARSRGGLLERVLTGGDETSRVGFAWVEFARGDDVFTVGARIRASRTTNNVVVAYFTTSLAIGDGLDLLDHTRTPLSRKALAEAIGGTGRVHDTGAEHRAAVREVLFPGFSVDRYASVVGALLALRKEKLSQNLDLDKLSDVLTEALPPLDEHDVAAVAEGFERLDRRKAELLILERELHEVQSLADRQRAYARAVVVAAADSVRKAETQRDQVTRNERLATEARDEAKVKTDATAGERREVQAQAQARTIEIDALKDSNAYREGAALADLRTNAAALRDVAHRADERFRQRAERADEAGEERAEAERALEVTTANLALADREVREAATLVGAQAVVAEAAQLASADDAEPLVDAWIGSRSEEVHEVRAALGDHRRAVEVRTAAEARVGEDENRVDACIRTRDDARAEADEQLETYRSRVAGWAASCHVIGAERVLAALPVPIDEPDAVGAAVGSLRTDVQVEFARDAQRLEGQRADLEDTRATLEHERARWAEGGLVAPDGPEWRSSRSGRRGAPLWQLVDVAERNAADGLEAALTGAGLLDAWVEPDGQVDLGGERADILLTVRPHDSSTLADALVPVDGAAVPSDVVGAVLRSVALVDADVGSVATDVVVARDGTFRLGAAVGAGPRRPAVLLGAVARERHRLERLAAVDGELAGVAASFDDLERETASLERRRAAVDAELDAVPAHAELVQARVDVHDAVVRLDVAERRLAATRDDLVAAESAVRDAVRALTTLADFRGLPSDEEGLALVERGLHDLGRRNATWARRRRDRGVSEQTCIGATERALRAAADRDVADQEHTDADRRATEVEGRVAALESSVGAEYAELVERLAGLGIAREQALDRARVLDEALLDLRDRLGELRAELAMAVEAREQAERARVDAQDRFVAAVAALGADAEVDVVDALDTASSVLAAARAIVADHVKVDVDDQAIERLLARVRDQAHQAQASLSGRVDVQQELAEQGWWLVRTRSGGLARRAGELAASLALALDQGRQELAEDEERLFEQTLAGSVRRSLADRIRLANGLVDAINGQLAAVRTAAGGVEVRLRWDVDPDQPDAVRSARALLLRDPADLTDGERSALQAFVRARVDQARAELEANAPWEARLRETLDYRAWHRFSLLLAHRDWDGYQPATASRLQRLSTGERSIALHLPMIASVAAHYAGDDGLPSACPRLILLDELFAGVDSENRAQLFGTFTTWDLDAVFTSDHEWCQYASLDGIAIHHLHPPSGDEPVTSTRFTWDGHRRRADALAT
jgi:uncharacterized protein (TIGR02680 family)